MNIDFELYRVFYTVADVGNITKAAEKLMISQPAVSKSIKSLEEQLGGFYLLGLNEALFLQKKAKSFINILNKLLSK